MLAEWDIVSALASFGYGQIFDCDWRCHSRSVFQAPARKDFKLTDGGILSYNILASNATLLDFQTYALCFTLKSGQQQEKGWSKADKNTFSVSSGQAKQGKEFEDRRQKCKETGPLYRKHAFFLQIVGCYMSVKCTCPTLMLILGSRKIWVLYMKSYFKEIFFMLCVWTTYVTFCYMYMNNVSDFLCCVYEQCKWLFVLCVSTM